MLASVHLIEAFLSPHGVGVFRMTFLLNILVWGVFALGLSGGFCAHAAASAPLAPPPAKTGAMESAPPLQQKARIAPHRAIYKIRTVSVKNGGPISNVSGRMEFEWGDVCDGWTIQQRVQMHFVYADGGEEDMESAELSWEAKDGRSYNFNIRRVLDGTETERYRGKAVKNEDGTILVKYTLPEEKNVRLPAGTLFPSAHTLMVMHMPPDGDKFLSSRVFDGADEEPSDTSAFLLPEKALKREPQIKTKLKKNPLLKGLARPVHFAFFKPSAESQEPDYEMDVSLLPNGVARYLKIEYRDFSVVGALEEIQALQHQNCP